MPDQFLFSLTIAGIYLLAGSVKGVFGIGLPTTSITLMTLFIAPLEAIAINLLPMFVTNEKTERKNSKTKANGQ